MKRNTWIIIGVLLLGGIAPLCSGQTAITLEECLTATEKNYPLLEQKKIQQELGERLQKALWYAYIPQLSLEGTATHQSDVLALDIKMPEVMGTELPPPTLPKISHLQYNAYLQATQLIWDGGRVKARTKQIEAATKAEQAELDVQVKRIKESVTELYFSLLLVDKQIELQEILLKKTSRQVEKVNSLLENGLASQNDKDLVAVGCVTARQNRQSLEQSRKTIVEALAIYTGMSLSDEVVPMRPETPYLAQQGGGRVAPLRPEYHLLDTKELEAQSSWQSYLAQGMPTLALFARGGYGKPGLNMLDPDPSTYYIAGLTLSWNFGKLYDYSAQRQKLLNTSEIIGLQRELLEKGINAELCKVRNEVADLESLIKTDEELVKLHRRIAERAEVQEAEGTLSTVDYLQHISKYNGAKKQMELHEIQLLQVLYRQKIILGL